MTGWSRRYSDSMELRHLRAFQAVARGFSFTRAATDLHYSQSTISEQVRALEAELGVRLFERAGRGLTLTSAGERLAVYADQVLALVETARGAVDETMTEPAGTLIIGGLETLCATVLPPVLGDYRARYSNVAVTVRPGTRGELFDAVRDDKIDACFTFSAPPGAADLRSEALRPENLLVVAPARHRLAGLRPVALADLRAEHFLTTEPGCGFREMFDRTLGRLDGQGPRVVAEVGSIGALAGCVAAGMGLALLPAIAVAAPLERGQVVALPIRDAEYRVAITMTWARRKEARPSIAALLATARNTLGPKPRIAGSVSAGQI
jgi:DNA-binding transcriptional LysR family regulator